MNNSLIGQHWNKSLAVAPPNGVWFFIMHEGEQIPAIIPRPGLCIAVRWRGENLDILQMSALPADWRA